MAWSVAAAAQGPHSIVGTPHDLSGGAADGADRRICDHCHVVHRASSVGPLWSRALPDQAYVLYSSSTLVARLDQPDGDSKLCLSCHDGTLAGGGMPLGGAPAAGGADFPDFRAGQLFAEPRSPVLGSDLSDDHPISFIYDMTLAVKQGALAVPEQTPSGLGGTVTADLLDERHKVQCTTCHDAHDDAWGDFLRLPPQGAQPCRTCHRQRDYELSAHMASQSPRFEENCLVCHVDHGGARSTPLLSAPQRELCSDCHASQAAAMGPGTATRHDLQDEGSPAGRRLTCGTCHEPHTVRPQLLFDRQFVSDPDDPLRPRPLVPEPLTPHGYRTQPELAAQDPSDFCMDCHDGTWPGALDIDNELLSSRALQTSFVTGRRSLHSFHANRTASDKAVGCTYCHDVHGTPGNRGVPRGRLLYEWLTVRDFPYRGKGSCSTQDVLGRCHD